MATAAQTISATFSARSAPPLATAWTVALLLFGGTASGQPVAGVAPAAAPAWLAAVNNGKYGGRGADLIPLQPTVVRLRSADVGLTYVPLRDGWQVTARYELYNPTAAPVALTLLFPEELCPSGQSCGPASGGDMFQDIGTRFGDQLLTPTAATSEQVRPWSSSPGKGYLYQLTVPPQKPIKLSHEYRYDASSGSEWSGVHYLSSAGQWGGPIERVRYVIDVRPTPFHVLFPRSFGLKQFSEQVPANGSGPSARLVFATDGIASRRDFLAAFPADALLGATSAGVCAGFRGDQSDESLPLFLRSYPVERLRVCRDLVYALHGTPFREPALRLRFYGPPALPAWADAKSFAIVVRPENRGFKDAQLSPGERAYIKALTDAEKAKK